MGITRHTIHVLTLTGGGFTGFSDVPANGEVVQVTYVPGSAPIDTNGDIDITGQSSGVVVANHDNIGTAAFTKVYKQPVHSVAGAAALYAAGGEGVVAGIFLAQEKIKLVVANGADAKSGVFHIYVKD